MLRRKHGVKINKGQPHLKWGFPGGSDGKESAGNTGDAGQRRLTGYSCKELDMT